MPKAANVASPPKPMSTAQTSMLVEQELNEYGANSGSLSVTLCGEEPTAFVKESCEALVERHPALRTFISASPAGLVQTERDVAECLTYTDDLVPCVPGSEQEQARAWVAARYSNRRWHLDREAPIKFHLLRHDDERATLAVPVHHIAFDGRSKFVFADDFSAYLSARRRGEVPPRDVLQGAPELAEGDLTPDVLEAALACWRDAGLDQIQGLNLPRRLATAWDRREIRGSPEFTFAVEEVRRLRAFARAESVSLFGALMTVVSVVLWAYGNRSAVMTVSVDASTPSTANRIGRAVNVVPLVTRLEGNDDLRAVLRSVRHSVQQLRRFRGLPFHDVVNARVAAGQPTTALYDLGVTYVRVPDRVPEIHGLDATWDFFAPNFGSLFDITLQLRVSEGRVFGRLDHLVPTVSKELAEAFSNDIAGTLSKLVSDPDTPIAELFITNDVRPSIRTQTTRCADDIGDLVSRAADRTPQATAVVCEGESLTYVAFDRGRLELAHILGQAEPRMGAVVLGHMTPQELLVAVVAVLSSGGTAFIGPSESAQRLGIGVSSVVESRGGQLCVHVLEGTGGLSATGNAALLIASPEGNLTRIPSAAIASRAYWLARRSVAASGRTLHHSTPPSPFYLAETFSTLAAGGTLVVPPEGGGRLPEIVDAERINRIYLRAHELHVFSTAHGESLVRTTLREAVVAADDVWPTAAIHDFQSAGVAIDRQLTCRDMPVVIAAGRPDRRQPRPDPPVLTDMPPQIGVEIRAPGGHLAPRGVAGAMRVLTDGVSPTDGDYARMTLRGGVEWLGRRDGSAQPALAGRLAELAARISSVPDVQTVHLSVSSSAKRRPVTAFVCVSPGSRLEHAQVREALRHSLSLQDALGEVVLVHDIPRDRDGAVDAAALMAAAAAGEPAEVPSEGTLVRKLCALWAWLFDLPHAEPDADFYELGGHSLMAMRLLARLRGDLHVRLSPRDLMDNPTPLELAAVIERAMDAECAEVREAR